MYPHTKHLNFFDIIGWCLIVYNLLFLIILNYYNAKIGKKRVLANFYCKNIMIIRFQDDKSFVCVIQLVDL